MRRWRPTYGCSGYKCKYRRDWPTNQRVRTALEWTQTHAADLQVPLLLIHGDADPITPADGNLAFFKNVKMEDRVLKLYEGGYHQAFIDSNREEVPADVADWLGRHA